jgi:hypothetical protein
VAVLGLLALFTHIHLFWVAALLLAMIDLPDFSTPLRSIAVSVAKMAGAPLGPDAAAMPNDVPRGTAAPEAPDKTDDMVGKDGVRKGILGKDRVGKDRVGKSEVQDHA